MRIIGGEHRGRALAALGKGDAAAHLRPTSDRVRESLFNVLTGGAYDGVHDGDPIRGARVLDLFAGTGALSFEALSRGAQSACLVERGRVAQDLIRRNAGTLGLADRITLLRQDATRLGPAPGAGYALVFLDPPYGQGLGERAMERAIARGWLAPGALVVWEDSAPPELPAPLEPRDRRRYGDTWIVIARHP